MKKSVIFAFILAVLMLSACNGLNLSKSPTAPAEQAGADTDLATRVSKILTIAATQSVKSATPTAVNTTKAEQKAESTETAGPTSTPEATATPLPSATALPTQEPTALAEAPTVAPTLLATVETATVIPTAMVNVTPIATSTDDPGITLGTPTSKDPLDKASLWSWPTETDQYTSVKWENGSMKITALSTTAGWRLPVIAPAQNIYMEMNARTETCSGRDSYGLYFHVNDKTASSGYWFIISCDGYYRLGKWDGNTQPKGTFTSLLNWTASKLIRKGDNQPNKLGVMVKSSNISLYINGNLVKTVQDSSYPTGYFGVFVNGKNTNNFTVDIDDISYWNDPK